MKTNKNIKKLIFFKFISYIILACGQLNVGIETTVPFVTSNENDSNLKRSSNENLHSDSQTEVPEIDYSDQSYLDKITTYSPDWGSITSYRLK